MSMCAFMNVWAHVWVWVQLPTHRGQKKAFDPLELQWWVFMESQLVAQVLGSRLWSPWLHSQDSYLTNHTSVPYFYSMKVHLYTPCLDLIPLWDVDRVTARNPCSQMWKWGSSERRSSPPRSLLLNETGREPCVLLLQHREGVVIKTEKPMCQTSSQSLYARGTLATLLLAVSRRWWNNTVTNRLFISSSLSGGTTGRWSSSWFSKAKRTFEW